MSSLQPVLPEPAAFRAAVSGFATGVCVIATRFDGVDHAMTANSFASVSLEPALVLFCVARRARFHQAVTAAGEWTVSILAEPGEAAARWLSTPGRPLAGQLDQVPHLAGPVTGLPVLTDSVAALECSTSAVHEAGDHSIVVGRVTGLLLGGQDAGPLLYHHRGYRSLTAGARR